MCNFEVYEVEEEVNSFTDNKQRLIYIDRNGLYIVEKNKNTVEDVFPNYQNKKTFGFKGEIIKISAIDGKREMSGFDENQKEILAFNCPSDAPVSFEVEATPVMKQIEKITGVKLVTPPPSEEAALKRMAEILDVPVESLIFENGQVKLASQVKIISGSSLPSFKNFSFGGKTQSTSTKNTNFSFGNTTSSTTNSSSLFGSNFNTPDILADNPLIDKLKGIIGVSAKESPKTPEIPQEIVRDYKFDTSDEAKKRRKEIALKPWDEE